MPSPDPPVFFGSITYLYNMERDVDQTFGTVTVGNVDPGDSVSMGFGFGFALNPRFSYSLGYSHSYVMATETELNGLTTRSTELQVGTLQLGLSFRATERLTIATSVDVGVTEDAPDVRVSLRTVPLVGRTARKPNRRPKRLRFYVFANFGALASVPAACFAFAQKMSES